MCVWEEQTSRSDVLGFESHLSRLLSGSLQKRFDGS